jgi:hypothetical protein
MDTKDHFAVVVSRDPAGARNDARHAAPRPRRHSLREQIRRSVGRTMHRPAPAAVTHRTPDELAQLHGAARRVGPVQTSADDATRAAGIIVGAVGSIVLVAIGLGALATRLVSTDAAFTVALSVTTTASLIGGLAAGPVLHRLARNQRRDDVTAVDPQGRSTADGDVAPGE